MKKNSINKVLIALDYDENAQKVAEAGFSVAKAMNAKVYLLHVLYEQPVYYSGFHYMSNLRVDIMDDLMKSTEKFLSKTKKHLGDEAIEVIVKEGNIAEKIMETANELKVDMIVLGTHSRKWIENIMMGSEAEAVLKRSDIPLFIVPTKKRG